MGVLPTRSFRPNPIGMSLVACAKGIECRKRRNSEIGQSGSGADGTPVVDIKPYLPFAGALPDAASSYTATAPIAEMPVKFYRWGGSTAYDAGKALSAATDIYLHLCWRKILARLIVELKRQAKPPSGCASFNVRWRVVNTGFEVFALEPRPISRPSLLTSLARW